MAHRIPIMLLALAAPSATAVAEPPLTITQLTIHERIVIRVPRARVPAPTGRITFAPAGWKEGKGPKCLSPREFAAVAITAPAAVDLLMIDGRRMRAKFGRDCRSADFYSGLYIRPGVDGQVCADRDAFRVRSGARCEIDDFKVLTPKR